MAKEKTRRIRLTHNCGIPEAEGMPGTIVECDEELAHKLVKERKGAVYVDDDPKPDAAERKKEDPVESTAADKRGKAAKRETTARRSK